MELTRNRKNLIEKSTMNYKDIKLEMIGRSAYLNGHCVGGRRQYNTIRNIILSMDSVVSYEEALLILKKKKKR